MFGHDAKVILTYDNTPVHRTAWMRAEAVPVLDESERLELAPGVWIIRQRQWWPVSVLDSAESMPWDDDVAPVRRTFPHPEWHTRAACHDAPSALFFGVDDEHQAPEGEYLGRGAKLFRSARALCQSCVVRLDCLTQAMTQPEEFGIWAGTTGRQRMKMRAQVAAGEPTGEVITQWLGKMS